jgi:Integrase core domain/HTH-like domain/Helix-turn-helix domain
MRLLDEQYLRTPFWGVRNMTWWLRQQGWQVNGKHVRRLLRVMGLEAIYAKPRLSIPSPGHRIYPYLLRDVTIDHPDQCWAADITYIRMRGGFVYLVTIMDWYSRYVLSWEVSVSMESSFCAAALDWALQQGQPEMFNTDQGAQFTSVSFTGRLEKHGAVKGSAGGPSYEGSSMRENVQRDDRWLTIQELMEHVPLSERTLRKIAKVLHPVRVNGRGKLLISKTEFDAWLMQHSSNRAESASPQAVKLLKHVFAKAK